jgi:hypothetical protein
VSWLSIALLALALAVLVGAEWPRLEHRLGADARRSRDRSRRKASLRVVQGDDDAEDPLSVEREKFAASVQRDLSRLPTIEEREENGRR